MKKRLYREGDGFAVPLSNGDWAAGIIARVSPRSGIIFGYFFSPRQLTLPRIAEIHVLHPKETLTVMRFGGLALEEGEWPVIGRMEPWERERWPLCALGRKVPGYDLAYRVEYPDDDPNGQPREVRISIEEWQTLPDSALYGDGAVVIVLEQLLPGPTPSHQPIPSSPTTSSYSTNLTIDYYSYAPTEASATQLAGQLRKEGYAVAVTESAASNIEWCVRATAAAPTTEEELDRVEEEMEARAHAVGGAYDGYERDV